MTRWNGPIVVGFDDSPAARLAVAWAAEESRVRNLPLRIVHSYLADEDSSAIRYGVNSPAGGTDATTRLFEDLRQRAERLVEQGVEAAKHTWQDATVHTVLSDQPPGALLRHESQSASMVVMGTRGHKAFTDAILGSVSLDVATHVHVPIVVINNALGMYGGAAPVVVGVDVGDESQAAIGWAFDFASRHGCPLHAVHAWDVLTSDPSVLMVPPVLREVSAVAEGELRISAEALAGWQDEYPDVVVTQQIVRGDSPTVLREAAAHARILVLGTRGHGRLARLLQGSTSRAILHQSPVPVAVIHGPGKDQRSTD